MSVQWRENQESSKMKSKGKRMLITSKKWCSFLLPLANKAIIIKRIFFWAEGCYVKKKYKFMEDRSINYHLELYLIVVTWFVTLIMYNVCHKLNASYLDVSVLQARFHFSIRWPSFWHVPRSRNCRHYPQAREEKTRGRFT